MRVLCCPCVPSFFFFNVPAPTEFYTLSLPDALPICSDGPVNLLVCDFKTPSSLRAYARFNEKKLEEAVASGHDAPEELLGKGTLALTIDQGEHMQRYQGIVALDGSSLEEIARNYFKQSEQIPTEVKLGVATLFDRDENGHSRESWRAGGVLVQHLPKSSIESKTTKRIDKKADLDHWTEVKALVDTIESSEMTDPQVGRSEERRVGKECRSRWSPSNDKKQSEM